MGKLRVLQVIQGQTVVWEGVKEPKGVLLTFHGCSHAATDWWDMQESCPGCIGASLRRVAADDASGDSSCMHSGTETPA